ncbi:hypothetical protein MPSI1_003790 [Malassezia psittaci]|uniref:Maintenance of telomere capping protein 1 n=1 Tax=Malassezia psittaci TaxID=1821823 RepID=A0AAF0FIJ7_9BASI|nr:hypothetical protein MPSI1_003790 [Malassezia psittaci]
MSANRKQEVDALLADLSFEPNRGQTHAPPRSAPPRHPGKTDDAQSLLEDLEGLVQRRRSHGEPREPSALPARASTEQARKLSGYSSPTATLSTASPAAPKDTDTESESKIQAVEALQSKRSPRKSTEASAKLETSFKTENKKFNMDSATTSTTSPTTTTSTANSSWGQWGGNLFSNATRIADQARQEIEKRAASVVPKAQEENPTQTQPIQQISNQFAERFRGLMKDAGLDSLSQNLTAAGKRGWNDILNAVAPPMEAHESVHVTLSHDMVGYDGIESLAFTVLSRMLQQADITHVDVHKQETQSLEAHTLPCNALHIAEDRQDAVRTAKAALEPLMQGASSTAPKPSNHSLTVPDSICPILLRLQPFYESNLQSQTDIFAAHTAKLTEQEKEASSTFATDDKRSVAFLVWWVDPTYRLSHTTLSQAIPGWWLSIPVEQNAWVEQAMCDALEGAMAIVAQDYVQTRLAVYKKAVLAARHQSESQAPNA